MTKKTVVLAGDNAYISQIETTIKSLCVHHDNLEIFVFNQDIPQEWFLVTRRLVEQAGSTLKDVRIFHDQLTSKWYNKNLPHINYMTYARYFIPQFVEADRVLYVDSDLIVTAPLDELFSMDLGDNYVAAGLATYGIGIGFNAGVLVINNKLWKEENISQKLLDLTMQEVDAPEGDQTILNMLFADRYHRLDHTYNFQIGFDMGAAQHQHNWIFEIPIDPLPKIIHYISGQKPWQRDGNMRLKEVWWHYRNLEWSQIIGSKAVATGYQAPLERTQTLHCFTLTMSDTLEQIQELVEMLPQVRFHIAAYTTMSDRLIKLAVYENVRLYPAVLPVTVDRLIKETDVYLDTNHGEKFPDLVSQFREQNKPVLAFDNARTEGVDEEVFSVHDRAGLAARLESLASTN